MTRPLVTMLALLRDLRALFTREIALIVAVGAPFVFLPAYAVQLLTAPLPKLPGERTQEAITRWRSGGRRTSAGTCSPMRWRCSAQPR